jgi:dGTPase
VSVPWEEERRQEEPHTFDEHDARARLRTAGERDRDRVLYSSAFQRLGGITQVMPTGSDQAVHSRLTHSLKVAQVSRRLAQRLVKHHSDLSRELDPDSVEASALVHDLGHPPFGHIAEEELNAFADSHKSDGFEGNAQSFRIATRLAQRWPTLGEGSDRQDFGLNLTRRTLDGVLKYPWPRNEHSEEHEKKWGVYKVDNDAFRWVRERRDGDEKSPAAQVMDWADDVTYAVHDMEDFFRVGMVPIDRLCTSQQERDRFFKSFAENDGLNKRLRRFDPAVLEKAVAAVFETLDFVEPYLGSRVQRQVVRERSSYLIRNYMHAVDWDAGRLVIDPVPRAEVAVLKELTWFYVINRPELATVQDGQRRIIRELLRRFWWAADKKDYYLFPHFEQEVLKKEVKTEADKARLVCDFVARLTEGRAMELHRRLLGTSFTLLAPPAH